jgi:hypothetical protein
LSLARSGALFEFFALWPLLLFAQQPDQPPPIGIIDFYGLRTITAADVQKIIPYPVGTSFSGSDDEFENEINQTIQKLKALPNVEGASVELVCCDHGKSMIYVGIRERGERAWHFRDASRGTVRLPVEIMDAGKAFEAALTQAVEHGDASEDDSNGYALSKDPATLAVEKRFLILAVKYPQQLREVLRNSSDAAQRAQAAQVLGYSADKQSVVPDLLRAMRDFAPIVRNDAMRALAVMATYAQANPQAHLKIPADGFIDLLDSVRWTDRNKSSSALLELTATRDPALLATLRERALPSLIEMAQWKSDGHALAAFFILGRIEGLPEPEIDKAWESGQRSVVIEAAMKLENVAKAN